MDKANLLIYDFDGVICDSVNIKTEAFVKLFEEYDINVKNEIIAYHHRFGGISRLKKIKYIHENLINVPISDFELNQLADKFSSLVKNSIINSKYINGALEFVLKHSTHMDQFICSGTPEDELCEIVEKKDNLVGYFKGVFGSPNSKEFIINQIIDNSKFSKRNVIFFGDAITDYNAAKECDVQFIGIKNENTDFPFDTFLIDDFFDPKLSKFNL